MAVFTFMRSGDQNCLIYIDDAMKFDPAKEDIAPNLRQLVFQQRTLPVQNEAGQVTSINQFFATKNLARGKIYNILVIMRGNIGDKISVGKSSGPNDAEAYQFTTILKDATITTDNSQPAAEGFRTATMFGQFKA